jgi:hypothetical protein
LVLAAFQHRATECSATVVEFSELDVRSCVPDGPHGFLTVAGGGESVWVWRRFSAEQRSARRLSSSSPNSMVRDDEVLSETVDCARLFISPKQFD